MAYNNAHVIDFAGGIFLRALHYVYNTIRKIGKREGMLVSVNETSIKCLFLSRLV